MKKLLALTLAMAMIFSMCTSVFAYSDVKEGTYVSEAVTVLSDLGIFNGYVDGSFKPENAVTRAEMAKLIVAMQGRIDSVAGKAVTKFSDVPATHWASGYIAAATGTAIDGRPDGTFGPEEEVMYEDAIKMIMATLGYTVVANANGGYPMGYVSAAIKEGVTADVVQASVGTPATRGTIAQLIYNAIDTPLVEQITWNLDGSGDFIKYDGESKYAGEPVEYKTLMTENLNVVKGEAIVLGTNFYGFEADGAIDKEDELAVNLKITKIWGINEDIESVVLAANSGAEDFLGKAIKFFAFQDKYDDWTLLSVVADEAYNKTVTFPIAALDVVKTDAEALYYFKDDAKTSTKLAIDADDLAVMDNNIAGDIDTLLALTAEGVAVATGFVTVIDNDKDPAFDAVIIETAKSAVVDSVEDGVIVLKGNDDITEIDTEDDALLVKFVKDGVEIAADAIAEGDILSLVYADGYGYTGYLVVDVMQNTVEGILTSTKASASSIGGKAYKVDGKWYDSAIGALDLKVGDTAKFYIDKFGRIAYVDETVTISGNYAYIYGTYFEEAEEGSYKGNEYTLQILTKDGVKEYATANTFYVNGEKYELKTMDAAIAALAGKLADITFAGDTVKKIILEDADDDILANEGSLSGKYVAEDLEIGTVACDKDTVVFFIEDEDGIIKKDESYVGTLADIEDGAVIATGAYYSNKKTDEDANVLVVKNLGTAINAASGLAIITDVVDAINADEEGIYEIEALYNGKVVALTTTNDIYVSDYEPAIGDIVKIKVNSNKITNLICVSSDTKTIVYSGDDVETIKAGYATAINATSKKITVEGEVYNLNKFDNIYVIDNTGRKISIKKGTTASFKFDERLYDENYAAKHIYVDGDSIGTVAEKATEVADYAIIRDYDDGEVLELVIVKGVSYTIKNAPIVE